MKSPTIIAVTLALAVMVSSCERGPQGREPETKLAAATVAADPGKVRELTASGADPNKVVDVDGRQQSPWFLALALLRDGHPEQTDVVLALLKAGADPKVVWGTDSTGPQKSFWQKLSGPGRQAGLTRHNPLSLAMRHPVAEVIKALLAAGADVHYADASLAGLVEANDVDMLHLLVDAGANVNSTASGVTPLLAAINSRNVALMTYLEEHGARENP